MTTTSAIHTRTATADPGTTLTATKVTTTGSRISRTNRRKVKDFNDSITCSLCNGYLIEATTINDCLHTFCRSCIVRHLEGNKYCPKCKSYNNKTITVANLRPDRILRSLVYKLVPGLHRSENQRAAKYYADQCSQDEHPAGGSRKPPDHSYLDDQNFFSPDELINLSLEYHYDSIVDYDPKKQELPITYLCCPAAVTIHHLYKFILTKNGLQLDNERIQVDIIYEDEILPHEFTLMDVAYCFNYKRSSLMRLYYRIFIHPTANPTATTTTYNVGSDKNSNENNKYSGGERDANNSTGRSNDANRNEPSQGSAAESSSSSSPSSSSSSSSSSKPTSTSPNKNASAASTSDANDKTSTSSTTEPKEADSQIKVQNAVKSLNNDPSKVSTETSVKQSFQPSEASCYSKYDSKLIITKTNKTDKGGSDNKEKESLKLVLVPKKSDKNDAKIVYSKSDSKASKSPKQNNPSATVSFGDFKRLRSNDIRYSDYESSSGAGSTSTKVVPTPSSKNGTVPGDDSKKIEIQNTKKHNKINDCNNPSDSSGKKISEDNSRNKVYGNGAATNQVGGESAAAQQVCVAKSKHEKSKVSPRRESNGSPVAITAPAIVAAVSEKSEKSSELKCYVNLKKQTVVSPLSSSAELYRKEVPKLKIELPSLKTKITIPKPDTEKSPKSVHSSSTSSSAATSPTTSSSASGKSPMWPKPDDAVKSVDVPSIDIEEYAKTIGLKPVHKISTSDSGQKKKKKSSTSSSPDLSFHRKRKKAKHSKESGGKRRKLHAEISSQHDESLKMKVKLTEKPSKHERKPSEEITPKEPTKHNTEVTPSSSLPAPTAPPPPALPFPSPAAVSTTLLTPQKEDSSKVIDITKGDDDDDVKIIEQPTLDVWPMASENVTEKSTTVATRVNELPNLPSLSGSDSSTKAKINEMRAIRHKPMVYIPNLDKNLSDNSPTINNLIQSVQAKTGFIDKDNDVQIVSTSRLEGNTISMSKVPMPPLVPTKPISTVPSMKPPVAIPSTASNRMVSTNSIPKPQQRMTAQSQQVFSPRHTPSYPPLALQSVPKKVITPTTSNSTNVYQPRNVNPSLKRSISVDSNSTHNVPPKTPRVDLMELNAQNQFLKKPIYAPMFNFVKGASLAKNGNPNRLPTSANDVPYKSPISSSYTKEMNTKKPVPSLLLPPSSISVTKMTDTVPQPMPVDNRPALEIVRIPSTAPVADKPQTSPKSTSVTQKASRPPPPTIPLIKIKKSASVPEQPTSPISPSVFQVTSSSTNSSSKLSTTCASHQDTGGALDLTTRANDDLIILEGSDSLTPKLNGNELKPKVEKRTDIDSSRLELINSLIQTSAASMIKAGSGVMAKLQSSIPGLKLPPEMIGFAITSNSNVIPKQTVSSPSSGSTMTTTTTAKSIPMPKLAEINRNRNPTVRQLNPSVRSIPNPSALAFRNQTIAISSSSATPAASFSSAVASIPSGGSTITSFSPTSLTTAARIMNVNMKTNAANATAGQKSSVNNNGIGSAVDTIPPIVPLLKTNTSTSISTYGMSKSTTTNGTGATNAVSNLNGNNIGSSKNDNVSSTSNGNGGGGKKTIEKVAAGLKAAADAAAVVSNGANSNRVSSSSSSNGNAASGVSKNGVNVA